MNFILFNVILLFAGFLAVFILTVSLMACLAPMALFAKSENSPKAFMLPLIGIAGIYQIYFWGFCGRRQSSSVYLTQLAPLSTVSQLRRPPLSPCRSARARPRCATRA